jgi:hypothetical protein
MSTTAHWENRGGKDIDIFYLISDKPEDEKKILGIVYPDPPEKPSGKWSAHGPHFVQRAS